MLMDIKENALIGLLTAGLPRSPLQRNAAQESDAEILSGNWSGQPYMAFSTDTLAEEIVSGLYKDPWLIGWMSVTVNMSDLAAVGATPLGILLAETIPPGYPQRSLQKLRDGIAAACDACGTFLLGGDTNLGSTMSITGCAIGTIGPGPLLSRIGCRRGDVLFSTGRLGAGSAFAASSMCPGFTETVNYRPHARLREGNIIRPFATACMDTSDGALATLDQLMRLNHTGFLLENGWERALDPSARKLSRDLDIPPWVTLAGEHGEFELIFTVPGADVPRLHTEAARIGWNPLRLGVVQESTNVELVSCGRRTVLLTAAIRNCFHLASKDLNKYLATVRVLTGEKSDDTQTSA